VTKVAIALGSNLGDREANLAFGLSALPGFITNLEQSRWHDTAPVGVSADQPRYLNGVVIGETSLTARDVLDHPRPGFDFVWGCSNRGARVDGASPEISRAALRARAAR
jgi:hypothetical protein